ncbi:hypothetical protein GGI35DRAFT_102202 [Trichoderma velutinum]
MYTSEKNTIKKEKHKSKIGVMEFSFHQNLWREKNKSKGENVWKISQAVNPQDNVYIHMQGSNLYIGSIEAGRNHIDDKDLGLLYIKLSKPPHSFNKTSPPKTASSVSKTLHPQSRVTPPPSLYPPMHASSAKTSSVTSHMYKSPQNPAFIRSARRSGHQNMNPNKPTSLYTRPHNFYCILKYHHTSVSNQQNVISGHINAYAPKVDISQIVMVH